MSRRKAKRYYVYNDISFIREFHGTESDILAHYGFETLRLRWAINQVVPIRDKYILLDSVDDPIEYLTKIDLINRRTI